MKICEYDSCSNKLKRKQKRFCSKKCTGLWKKGRPIEEVYKDADSFRKSISDAKKARR